MMMTIDTKSLTVTVDPVRGITTAMNEILFILKITMIV